MRLITAAGTGGVCDRMNAGCAKRNAGGDAGTGILVKYGFFRSFCGKRSLSWKSTVQGLKLFGLRTKVPPVRHPLCVQKMVLMV